MSLNLVPEDQLRAALRPYRVDPGGFEVAVRERLKVAERELAETPFAGLSPLRRSVAALLPLQLITGGKIAAANLAPATGVYKLLSYVAFPAISLFVLLGATVFGLVKIRRIQQAHGPSVSDQQALHEAISKWWRSHMWGALIVYAANFAISYFGATWLLFLFYIISFGLVLTVLSSFARLGLGNRRVIGQSCLTGLMFLGQTVGMSGGYEQEIHFVDQHLMTVVFYGGGFVLIGIVGNAILVSQPLGKRSRWTLVALIAPFFAAVALPMWWLMGPTLFPPTMRQIKAHVESFQTAQFGSATWRRWEIVASWTVERQLNPDLSGARRLLAEEIAGEKNPFVLGSAFRLGLVSIEQIQQLDNYKKDLRIFLGDPTRFLDRGRILSLEQRDWLIRASVLDNALTVEERDYLEKRLNATLEATSTDPYVVLETPLRVTQLLDILGRPIDRDQYRSSVHCLLQRFYCQDMGRFQVAGGFKGYDREAMPGDEVATSHAIQLMEIYGIPDDLDLNWVRSFLRPRIYEGRKWIAAVTLDRLNHIPGVSHPSWLQILYYERSLLAAIVLVALCIYATLSSPLPKADVPPVPENR